LLLFCTFCINAQDSFSDQLTEEQEEQLPWIQDTLYLENLLNARLGNSSDPNGRIETTLDAMYYVPLRLIIYRKGNGAVASAIPEAFAMSLVDQLNVVFEEANTGIKFFVQFVQFINSDFYHHEMNSTTDFFGMFAANRRNGVINMHFVKNVGGSLSPGYAINPRFPEVPYTEYSNYIETHDGSTRLDPPELVKTMAHELGHNLSLLHTHHPGRFASLIFNEDNATIENHCFQEAVSRDAKLLQAKGCYSKQGQRKCNVNGDFLCDTAADPNVSSENVRWIDDNNCSYTYAGEGDYRYDKKGSTGNSGFLDEWNPPTKNIMSYSSTACRNEFSWQQKAVMWETIETDFMNDYDVGFQGPDEICAGSNHTYSVNLPSELVVSWNHSSNLFPASQASGHSFSVSTFGGFAQTGWVEAEVLFPFGGTLTVRKNISMGYQSYNSSALDIETTGNGANIYSQNWQEIVVQSTVNFDRAEWTMSSGQIRIVGDGHSILVYPTSSAGSQVQIGVRVGNECGLGAWKYEYFTVVNTSTGIGIMH
jgi:hypothetical protein